MLGQAEVGFVLRVAIGFTVLIAVFYISYAYMEDSEKKNMQEFLENIGDLVYSEISRVVSSIPENSSLTERILLPSAGNPFSGGYYVSLENDTLRVVSYKWRNVGVIKHFPINSSYVTLSGYGSPPLLCINATRKGEKIWITTRC